MDQDRIAEGLDEDRAADAGKNEAAVMCAHCGWIATMCFWGHRPPARWKRPVLMVVGLLGVALACIPVFSSVLGTPDYVGLALAIPVLGTLSLLGLFIARH